LEPDIRKFHTDILILLLHLFLLKKSMAVILM
jgi:hypothetical protein